MNQLYAVIESSGRSLSNELNRNKNVIIGIVVATADLDTVLSKQLDDFVAMEAHIEVLGLYAVIEDF